MKEIRDIATKRGGGEGRGREGGEIGKLLNGWQILIILN